MMLMALAPAPDDARRDARAATRAMMRAPRRQFPTCCRASA